MSSTVKLGFRMGGAVGLLWVGWLWAEALVASAYQVGLESGWYGWGAVFGF